MSATGQLSGIRENFSSQNTYWRKSDRPDWRNASYCGSCQEQHILTAYDITSSRPFLNDRKNRGALMLSDSAVNDGFGSEFMEVLHTAAQPKSNDALDALQAIDWKTASQTQCTKDTAMAAVKSSTSVANDEEGRRAFEGKLKTK